MDIEKLISYLGITKIMDWAFSEFIKRLQVGNLLQVFVMFWILYYFYELLKEKGFLLNLQETIPSNNQNHIDFCS